MEFCTTVERFVSSVEENEPSKKRRRVPGPVPYYEQFPVEQFVKTLLESTMSGADRVRATSMYITTMTSSEMGSRVREMILNYVRTYGLPVPSRLISDRAVRRMGLPPKTSRLAARFYKEIVPFKTAPRNNDYHMHSPHLHFASSMIKQYTELCAYFPDDFLMLSCDNKNKIVIGTAANANPTCPRGMFMVDQQPMLPDHTFPTRGNAKINPMGYMLVHNATVKRTRHSSIDRHCSVRRSVNFFLPRFATFYVKYYFTTCIYVHTVADPG